MKIAIKLDGLLIVLKAVKNIRNDFEFEESVSDEFKNGFLYALDRIIIVLENLEDDNDKV